MTVSTAKADGEGVQLVGDVYAFTVLPETAGCKLILRGLESEVFASAMPLLLSPDFDDIDVEAGPVTIMERQDLPHQGCKLVLRAPFSGDASGWIENGIYAFRDRLICTARYLVDRSHHVRHWRVLPARSRLGLPSVHAFEGEGLETIDGKVLSTDNLDLTTASHNVIFWNVLPCYLLMDEGVTVSIGGTSIAHDYGLELKTSGKGVVEHLRFNYGGSEAPHPGNANEVQTAPRLQINITFGKTPFEAYAEHDRAMLDDGVVAPHAYRPEQYSWLRPWYCTWPDQVLLGRTLVGDADWHGQKKSNYVLNEDFVLRAAERIREWDMNVGTFVIDAGWQDKRGDWNPAEEKFPDMRGLVDRLHAMGFKVHLWFPPLQVERDAAIASRRDFVYPLGEDRFRGEYALDYTNPDVRDWISAKLDMWFSSRPGGWDIDGLKLDWCCERVRPVRNARDPRWRGEERTLYNISELFCGIAARNKQAYAIAAGPTNPKFAGFKFFQGIPEYFTDDLSINLKCYRKARVLMPRWRIKAHGWYFPETTARHVRLIRALGGIPEIGPVLPEHTSDAQMEDIRDALRE